MERVMIFIFWKADDNICFCQDVHIQEEASVVFNRAKQVIRQISKYFLHFFHNIANFNWRKQVFSYRYSVYSVQYMAWKFFFTKTQLAPFLQANLGTISTLSLGWYT